MSIYDLLPFLPDRNTYYVPRLKFRTADGNEAEGPMLRKAASGQEVLAWTDRDKAIAAAQELVAQTGGRYEIQNLGRKELWALCRTYSAWGSRVVAVVLK